MKTANRTFTVQISEGHLPLWWYYDVSAGDPEYVIVDYRGEGQAIATLAIYNYTFWFQRNPSILESKPILK